MPFPPLVVPFSAALGAIFVGRRRRAGSRVASPSKDGRRGRRVLTLAALSAPGVRPSQDFDAQGATGLRCRFVGEGDASSSGSRAGSPGPAACALQRPQRACDCRGPPLPERLGRLFDELPKEEGGWLGEAGIRKALVRLHEEHCACLGPEDAPRLLAFLGDGAARVGREAFCRGVQELLGVFLSLSDIISASRLKFVIAACFERFDSNDDGVLSPEEFGTALDMLKLGITKQQAAYLCRFYARVDAAPIQQATFTDSRPFWEKWASALEVTMENLQEHYGWSSVVRFAEHVHHVTEGPGTLEEKTARMGNSLCDGAELLVDTVEVFVELGAMVLAAQLLGDCCSHGLASAGLDEAAVDPLLMFAGLGAVGVMKELNELVPQRMDEDEALLYAQLFHGGGLSQAQYRRLLGCQGCRWRTVAKGEALSGATPSAVRLLVRGEAAACRGPARRLLKPGAVLGAAAFLAGRPPAEHEEEKEEAVVALEPVTVVEWEPGHLRECLEHDEATACHVERLMATSVLGELVALEELATGSKAVPDGAPGACTPAPVACAPGPGACEEDGCLLSSFRSALHTHAERKGLARLGYFGRQVLAAACGPGDLHCRAKRVLGELWDGTEDLAHFKKALADLAGTCTALVGMWQELASGMNDQGELAQDEISLLPFLVTVGLCGVHAVRGTVRGNAAELSELEAAAYGGLFKEQGFSVGEFRRLLRQGGARWESLRAGERLEVPAADRRLRLLARGRGRLLRDDGAAQAVAAGRLLGEQSFLDVDAAAAAPAGQDAALEAVEACAVLSLDAGALAEHLGHDTGLRAKLQRLVVAALARRLADQQGWQQEAQRLPQQPQGETPSPMLWGAAVGAAMTLRPRPFDVEPPWAGLWSRAT